MNPELHPKWTALRARKSALTTEIAAVIQDMRNLEDSEPVVLAEYSKLFGEHLLLLSRSELEAARLKREIELIQARLNHSETIHYESIEAALDEEFAEWKAKVEAQAARLAGDRQILDALLDPGQARKLKDLFRLLVKRLHPDLHPGQPASASELWRRVVRAYERQDLEELAALELITSGQLESGEAADDGPEPAPEAFSALEEEVSRLDALLEKLLTKLAQRRESWPFDQLPLLNAPSDQQKKLAEIQARIDTAAGLISTRKQWLNQLLGA